jgi:hypothetical protein
MFIRICLGDLEEGDEAALLVNVERINHTEPLRVKTTKFPKAKDVSFMLILGNRKTNEVIGLKRLNFFRFCNRKIIFTIPEILDKNTLALYLMTDSYIGLDQEYTVNLTPFLRVSQLSYANKEEKQAKNEEDDYYYSHYVDVKKEQECEFYDNEITEQSGINNNADEISYTSIPMEKELDNWI